MPHSVPSLANRRGVKAFAKWLKAAGAEVLPTKGEYEILRFRGRCAGLSLVHRSTRGRISFQGEAAECWEKYSTGQPHKFEEEELPPVLDSIGPDSGRIILDMATEGPVTIAAIMDRLRVTMGAASAFLSTETANGHLTRSGGGRGDAYRWESRGAPPDARPPLDHAPAAAEARPVRRGDPQGARRGQGPQGPHHPRDGARAEGAGPGGRAVVMAVQIYAMGAFMCSACAPAEMEGPAVAAEVQSSRPAGTEYGWQIAADPTFKGGEPNPCPCNTAPDRRHWLLEC